MTFKILDVVAYHYRNIISCVSDSYPPGLSICLICRAPSVEGQVDYGEVRGMVDTAALNMVERKFLIWRLGTIHIPIW